MRPRVLVRALATLLLLLALATAGAAAVRAADPVDGWASHYGPGTGVATQWCTWTLRHTDGCGLLAIQSHDTGLVAIAPVIDWCQCFRSSNDERIVDLQYGVVDALGLDLATGLYEVSTWRVDADGFALPDTSCRCQP